MTPWLLNFNIDMSTLALLSCGLALVYGIRKYIEAKRSPLNAIPTIGYSGPLSSYITAFKWGHKSMELVQEGYNKYPGQAFKIATISQWIVVLSGKQHMEDIRKASEDVVSFYEASAEVLQKRYTLGITPDDDPYHLTTIRSPLTRNIAIRFRDIRDEVVESFKDFVPLTEDWSPVSAYETVLHIVCRVSNRYFVGLPLCRDPDYLSLNETFAHNLMISAEIINSFPDFLKPLAGRYLNNIPKAMKQALGFLRPVYEARIAQENEANWENKKPNDLITWLLETTTQEYHRDPRDLALRILLVNFVAVHTSTMAATHALYDLAVHPECVQEMRDEAEAVLAEYGWTKAAMQRMRKVDSFLKESQRLNNGGSVTMSRKTIKDWRLSDGTLIPAGTFIGVASDAMNKEDMSFPDAHTFRGFRFAELRNGSGELDTIKHQMVSVEPNQVVFGYGRHACPGRFFAANEIKAIFSHILLNYDVRVENGINRPADEYFRTSIYPNTKARIMFRKRRM